MPQGTISSRRAAQAEHRKLQRYEEYAAAWAEMVSWLAERTQRSEFDLAMQRGLPWGGVVPLAIVPNHEDCNLLLLLQVLSLGSNLRLSFLAGPEHRARMELVETITRALPVEDRGDGASESNGYHAFCNLHLCSVCSFYQGSSMWAEKI